MALAVRAQNTATGSIPSGTPPKTAAVTVTSTTAGDLIVVLCGIYWPASTVNGGWLNDATGAGTATIATEDFSDTAAGTTGLGVGSLVIGNATGGVTTVTLSFQCFSATIPAGAKYAVNIVQFSGAPSDDRLDGASSNGNYGSAGDSTPDLPGVSSGHGVDLVTSCCVWIPGTGPITASSVPSGFTGLTTARSGSTAADVAIAPCWQQSDTPKVVSGNYALSGTPTAWLLDQTDLLVATKRVLKPGSNQAVARAANW